MKKILILFLLSFPIIIFTIVTLTSTVIAYYVPLAVEGIEMIEGSDINDVEIGNDHTLEFQILPANARDMSFDIKDENGNILVDYNQGELIYLNEDLPDHVIEINNHKDQEIFYVNEGLVKLNVKTINIGFTSLKITTKDGNYEITSDIMVLDPNKDPSEIQGVVLDYNKTNEHFKFGNKNEIEVGFTYFPKQAINAKNEEEFETVTNLIKENARLLQSKFSSQRGTLSGFKILEDENGRGFITIKSSNQNYVGTMTLQIEIDERLSKYEFNVDNGYNIVSEEELFKHNNAPRLFLLNHIDINKMITFNAGTKLYGNYHKIDHSGLKEYTEVNEHGKLLNMGRKAITFRGDGSGLYQTHIVGKLDLELSQPYENIVNVSMEAGSATDKLMEVKDVKIDYGRYNLSLKGRVRDLNDSPTVFNIDNVTLFGAFLSSLEVDNHQLTNTDTHATYVNVSRLYISYTAISVLLQNNRGGTTPGSILNLIEKDGIKAITSDSWRNLDDASGALSSANFGYILKELKSDEYSDVYYKDGKDYYVNPVIMLRGGSNNISKIIVNENNEGIVDKTMDNLIEKHRKPKGLIEIGIAGGTDPFVLYLLNPELYKEKGE